MRAEDDFDTGNWAADLGCAQGPNKTKLILAAAAVLVAIVIYLWLPLDRVWALLMSGESEGPITAMVSGNGLKLEELQGLKRGHVPQPPQKPPIAAVAEMPPTQAAPPPQPAAKPDTSALDQVNAALAAMGARLDGLTGMLTTGQPKSTPTTTSPDAQAQKRADAAKRRAEERKARLQSERIFLTRPKEEKVGKLHALTTPYSLPPNIEIPCETTMEVSSETPGAFIVVVSEDVPDVITRLKNVLPKFSRIGVKPRRSAIMGDSRIDVQATTVTFPGGPWMKLPAGTMTDQYGTAGFTGKINRHYLRNYGAVILTGVLRGGTTIAVGGYGGSTSDRVLGTVAQDAASEATRDIRQGIRTDPTIIVPNKYRCKYVTEDEMVLMRAYPWTR